MNNKIVRIYKYFLYEEYLFVYLKYSCENVMKKSDWN